MKAISMWQPHGSLLTTKAKPFETRGWSTKFRGPVLIHAAQRLVKSEWEFYLSYLKFRIGLAPLVGKIMDFSFLDRYPKCLNQRQCHSSDDPEHISFEAIPRGAFIGIGELIDCIPVEKMTYEQRLRSRGFGDFRPGRFAWEFADVRRFKTPIPAKGRQGFFFGHVEQKDMVFAH